MAIHFRFHPILFSKSLGWFHLLYFVLGCCTLVVDHLLHHLVLLLILLDLVVQFGVVKGQSNI